MYKKYKNVSKKNILLSIPAIFASLYFLALLLPLTSIYAAYPATYLKCGGNPVIGNVKKGGIKAYYLPDDRLYKLHPDSKTFCVEEEAKSEGYIRSDYLRN